MSSPDWAPSLENVAAYIPARTVNRNGVQLNTFDADTRPTGEHVSELAEQAAEDVLFAVGGFVPQTLETAARRQAALLAALHVELTLYPEQAEDGPYDRLKDLYDESLGRLITRVGDVAATDPEAADSSGTGLPAYAFPDLSTSVSWRAW